MTDYEKTQKAHALYDAIINNYKHWQRGGVGDRKARVDFYDQVVEFAKLDMPNPFDFEQYLKPKAEEKQVNAAIVPGQVSETGQQMKVTSVADTKQNSKFDFKKRGGKR